MARRRKKTEKTEWILLPHVIDALLLAKCPEMVARAHESYYRAASESGHDHGPLKRRPREAHVQRVVEMTSAAGLNLSALEMQRLCGALNLECPCDYCRTLDREPIEWEIPEEWRTGEADKADWWKKPKE
ncbi:MAG TPA: hypothetical protein VG796_14840 [Verrucomicrobiales bacterium]|nr:hypothetical protein [Verrucomicrobiales bacterium]